MVRAILRFNRGNASEPITSQVILEEKAHINILGASVNQLGGEILAEIPSHQADRVIKAFREHGVTVDVSDLIEKDDERCIHCGACVSLCPMDALHFEPDHSVALNAKKCNGRTCGLCIDACTRGALRLIG